MVTTACANIGKSLGECMSSEILSLQNEDKILIQITDTHLMDQPETEFVGINPEQNFHAVMQDIQRRFDHIDAILNTGDLAQTALMATYDRYINYMKQFAVDFYQIPGNHDNLDIFPFHDPQPNPTIIELGQWRVILLNSTVNGRTDGRIQTAQLKILKEILQNFQDYHVIIACHHNPFNMNSQWLDQHKLKNADELKAILAPFKNIKALLHGHVHQESNNEWNGIQFISTPATCVQFKPNTKEFAFDKLAPGYRCLHLKANGEFATQVHRLENFNIIINEEILGY